MKLAATLIAALLMAAPASAEVLLGGGCGGQTIVSTSGNTGKGTQVVIVTGGCAAQGPRREVIHTLTPGEPMKTTIVIRRQGGTGGGPAVINVAKAIEAGGGSSQARIVRVR